MGLKGLILVKFIKLYGKISRVIAAILAACFVILVIIGSKVVNGTALTDSEFTAFCVSLVTAAAVSWSWVILECAYQKEIAKEIMRRRRRARRGGRV